MANCKEKISVLCQIIFSWQEVYLGETDHAQCKPCGSDKEVFHKEQSGAANTECQVNGFSLNIKILTAYLDNVKTISCLETR